MFKTMEKIDILNKALNFNTLSPSDIKVFIETIFGKVLSVRSLDKIDNEYLLYDGSIIKVIYGTDGKIESSITDEPHRLAPILLSSQSSSESYSEIEAQLQGIANSLGRFNNSDLSKEDKLRLINAMTCISDAQALIELLSGKITEDQIKETQKNFAKKTAFPIGM